MADNSDMALAARGRGIGLGMNPLGFGLFVGLILAALPVFEIGFRSLLSA